MATRAQHHAQLLSALSRVKPWMDVRADVPTGDRAFEVVSNAHEAIIRSYELLGHLWQRMATTNIRRRPSAA